MTNSTIEQGVRIELDARSFLCAYLHEVLKEIEQTLIRDDVHYVVRTMRLQMLADSVRGPMLPARLSAPNDVSIVIDARIMVTAMFRSTNGVLAESVERFLAMRAAHLLEAWRSPEIDAYRRALLGQCERLSSLMHDVYNTERGLHDVIAARIFEACRVPAPQSDPDRLKVSCERARSAVGHQVISVAKHFSRHPGGRTIHDGPFSGQLFRGTVLAPALRRSDVTLDLDGTLGYGSSWLEEVFGGLVSIEGFKEADLKRLMIMTCASDRTVVDEAWGYISNASR